MIQGRARVWGGALVAVALGAVLRLWFLRHATVLSGDTFLYGDIALSWLQHGIYGFSRAPLEPVPTLIRLPGYPLFLALSFRIFGPEHYNAVLNTQAIVDLLACLVLAALVRRLFGTRSALFSLFLATLCPFTASYTAAALTETLTLATIVVAFYALERWRAQAAEGTVGSPWNGWLWLVSAALAYSILLRPEQVLLAAVVLPTVLCITYRRAAVSRHLIKVALPALAAALCTLSPLVPWTIRNASTFHVFEPLAPRSATDPGDPIPSGFNRWFRTWGVDFTSTEDVYWNYDGAAIEIADLPGRAFDSPAQYTETAAVLRDYNRTVKPTPELEARFNAIAEQRIHGHLLRYYIGLPVARLANMLLRPRVEMLAIPLAWWRWREHPGQTAFALAYGALNLAYLAFGSGGLRCWSRRRRDPTTPVAWSMIAFIVLRCALLLTLDNSEPRYTLEFFPVLVVGAAALYDRAIRGTSASKPTGDRR